MTFCTFAGCSISPTVYSCNQRPLCTFSVCVQCSVKFEICNLTVLVSSLLRHILEFIYKIFCTQIQVIAVLCVCFKVNFIAVKLCMPESLGISVYCVTHYTGRVLTFSISGYTGNLRRFSSTCGCERNRKYTEKH